MLPPDYFHVHFAIKELFHLNKEKFIADFLEPKSVNFINDNWYLYFYPSNTDRVENIVYVTNYICFFCEDNDSFHEKKEICTKNEFLYKNLGNFAQARLSEDQQKLYFTDRLYIEDVGNLTLARIKTEILFK